MNIRDLDEWLDSRLEHIGQDIERGHTMESPTWDQTDFAVKHWIETRNSFHQEVLEYFRDRPNDLLVLNYIREPEPGRKIAGFLGKKSEVSKQYERSTRITRERGVLRNQDRIHRCLNELGVPASTWKSDIHCPTTADSTVNWPYDSSALDYPKVLTPPTPSGAP